MKKHISIICALLILFTMLFSVNTTFASQDTDIETTRIGTSNTYYSYDSQTKTLTISGTGAVPNFTNSSGSSDSQPWFSFRSDGSIENVVVEEGVTSLGNYCLYCVMASNIKLPTTLTRLGGYAFAYNKYLTSLDAENLTTISNNAFYKCTSLESFYIPATVTYIGTSAFEGCTSLSSVEFGSNIMKVSISGSAFLNCPSLKQIALPLNATLGSYSIGFSEATKGSIYDDFTMLVYRDSKAYTYATKYFLNYELLDFVTISDGDEISRTYYDDSMSTPMLYYFTPRATAEYKFYSEGDVDVDCTVTNSNGEVVAKSTDNSLDDLNFTIDCILTGGETYCFTVESVHSTGAYTVYLTPVGFDKASIDWNFTLPSSYFINGDFDMLSYITGHNVDFTYLNGYVYHMPFEEGASYIGMELHYTSKANNDVECENSYTDYITVGEETLEFSYYVKHSYTQTVIAPTVSDGGYTIYTCLACGDEYKSDFTDKLGTDVYGYVKIMSNLNGDIIENSFVPYTPIYNNEGKLVATTDENGYFEVNDAYDYLIIASQGGPSRKINIVKDNADLGDIGVVYCDFNGDNYVNAKDFGLLRKWFGKYDEDDVVSKSLDINQNGELDFDDWEYASSFFAYGKLNESIYDY